MSTPLSKHSFKLNFRIMNQICCFLILESWRTEEDKEKKAVKNILEEIMAKKLPNLVKHITIWM